MSDVAAATGSDPVPEDETPNQKAARLRREKRQKKMAEQGEDRLAKIKALNGGVAPPAEVLGGPTAPPQPRQATVDDPDEVDIDTVSGTHTPASRGSNTTNNDPFAAMMQMQQQRQQGQQGGQQGGGGEDPMVQMMQQLSGLMGGNPQDPNDPNQPQQLPPMLQAMLRGQSQEEKDAAKAPETGGAYFWRIVHAIFAFSLAIYITLTSTFNGSALARTQSVSSGGEYGFGQRLFVIFTSAELVLQSTRFFVEKGQLRGSGMLAMVANSGFVPEPYAQWVRTAGRYLTIAQTVFADAMCVVFVFGVLAWWRGAEVN